MLTASLIFIVSCKDGSPSTFPIDSDNSAQSSSIALEIAYQAEETSYSEQASGKPLFTAQQLRDPNLMSTLDTVRRRELLRQMIQRRRSDVRLRILENGSLEMTVRDLTNKDSLRRLSDMQRDFSQEPRRLELSANVLRMYNDEGKLLATQRMNFPSYKYLLDSLRSANKSSSIASEAVQSVFASAQQIPNAETMLAQVKRAGGSWQEKGNGLIEVSMGAPYYPDNSKLSSLTTRALLDTRKNRLIYTEMLSLGKLQARSSFRYVNNTNNIEAVHNESYYTLPDGTGMRLVNDVSYQNLMVKLNLSTK